MLKHTIMFTVVAGLVLAPAPAATASVYTTFSDGQFHELDSTYSGIDVRDSFFGDPTSVKLLEPASVAETLYVYDGSSATLAGGYVGGVQLLNQGSFHLESGTIGAGIIARNDNRVTISGGAVGNSLVVDQTSQATITGGTIGVTLAVSDNAVVEMTGGTIDWNIAMYDSVHVTVSGGSIAKYVHVGVTSTLTFSGGTVGEWFEIWGSSLVTFVGQDFSIDGTPIPYGEYGTLGREYVAAHITGQLLSGDVLDNDFEMHGLNTKIRLIPEPATLTLLTLGGLAIIRRRRSC